MNLSLREEGRLEEVETGSDPLSSPLPAVT